jgi:hypothetical protein
VGTIFSEMAPIRHDTSRVLRFTVTTSLLAMPAVGCHRGGPPGGVYVNEGPQQLPPQDQRPADAPTTAPAAATDGDAPSEPVAETSPTLDIKPHEPDPGPGPVITTNTGPQRPEPPKPKVIVNPGPADRGGTTPTTPPRP